MAGRRFIRYVRCSSCCLCAALTIGALGGGVRPAAAGALRGATRGGGTVIPAWAAGGLAALSTASPTGTVIRVTTTADEVATDGKCSLREAIQAANTGKPVDACPAGPGPVTIIVPAGTYNLSLCALTISSAVDVTVRGAGAGATIIDGSGNSTPNCYPYPPGAGIFVIGTGTTAIICHMTLRGVGSPGAGAVDNLGAAVLVDTLITGNTAGGGGGIDNQDRLLLVSSVVSKNTALGDGGMGGGIANDGAATILNSLISGNVAGAPPSGYRGIGGGIWNGNLGNLTIVASTISGNAGETGGAILNDGALTLRGSTISGNTGVLGVGLYSDGTASLGDDTISGNTGTGSSGDLSTVGAGIDNFGKGTVTLNNVTIALNTANNQGVTDPVNGPGFGGGLANEGGSVQVENSIIAGNTAINGTGPDCGGPITAQGYILIQNPSGCTIGGTTTGDLLGASPRLGPLQNNGGPTFTQALLSGSPAIDAANPAPPGSGPTACLTTDQRGYPRPSPPGGRCDMGAYELQQ